MKMILSFYECEHQGDLDNYIDDLEESGAEILSDSIDYDDETGIVKIYVADKDNFLQKFRQTDSFNFSSLSD